MLSAEFDIKEIPPLSIMLSRVLSSPFPLKYSYTV